MVFFKITSSNIQWHLISKVCYVSQKVPFKFFSTPKITKNINKKKLQLEKHCQWIQHTVKALTKEPAYQSLWYMNSFTECYLTFPKQKTYLTWRWIAWICCPSWEVSWMTLLGCPSPIQVGDSQRNLKGATWAHEWTERWVDWMKVRSRKDLAWSVHSEDWKGAWIPVEGRWEDAGTLGRLW